MSSNVAYPGKIVGVIEEFFPGDGVYIRDGYLVSEHFGVVKRDMLSRTLSVKPLRTLVLVKVGDEVAGRIVELSGVYGVTKIEVVNGILLDRVFTGVIYPTRRLSENERQYKPGDMILAAVESEKNNIIHLSIKAPRYGVILARCGNCGGQLHPMVRGREGVLTCRVCGNREKRKISDLYGQVEKILRRNWNKPAGR